MRAGLSAQRVRHRAAAGAAADDDDVVAFVPHHAVRVEGSSRPRPSAAGRPSPARGSSRARGRRVIAREEVAIHRLIAADVAEAGKDQPRQAAAAREDEQAVRLERDDALRGRTASTAASP